MSDTTCMAPEDMLKKLAEEFTCIVRSPHHVQIDLGGRRYHDLWLTKQGCLKVRLYGDDAASVVQADGFPQFLTAVRHHDLSTSTLGSLKAIERTIKRAECAPAGSIFTDAGFRQGIARIAVIRSRADGFDLSVRRAQCDTSLAAENLAVALAVQLYPGDDPIHTNARVLHGALNGRVVCIHKENNREADSAANLRTKS